MRPALSALLVTLLTVALGLPSTAGAEEATGTEAPQIDATPAPEEAQAPPPEAAMDEPEEVAESDQVEAQAADLIRGPMAPSEAVGPLVGRLTVSLSGGWPAAGAEVSYAPTELFSAGLRVGYLYGTPLGSFGTTSGVLVELPTRFRLLQRTNLELVLEFTAGVAIGLDGWMALITDDLNDIFSAGDLRPLATELGLGVTVSWRIIPDLMLKLGFQIPTMVTLLMAERPYEDTWLLTVPFAVRVGAAYQIREWFGVFLVVDVGPNLVVAPEAWTSDGYDRSAGVGVYFRAAAGVTFAPWR